MGARRFALRWLLVTSEDCLIVPELVTAVKVGNRLGVPSDILWTLAKEVIVASIRPNIG